MSHPPLFIGLMSGTSLDGVDGVLAEIAPDYEHGPLHTLAAAYQPFPEPLRHQLLDLQSAGDNELHREALPVLLEVTRDKLAVNKPGYAR